MHKTPHEHEKPAGIPTRSTPSITDSAAFRKANSEAMESIKSSVARMKAERERFLRDKEGEH